MQRLLSLLLPVFAALMVCLGLATPAWAVDEKDLLPPTEAFQASVVQIDAQHLELHFKVAPGYYLYRDRIKVSSQPDPSLALGFPAGKQKNDPNFGKVEIYPHDLTVTVTASQPLPTGTVLTVRMQGCAEAGVCYPPQTVKLPLPARTSAATTNTTVASNDAGGPGGFFPVA